MKVVDKVIFTTSRSRNTYRTLSKTILRQSLPGLTIHFCYSATDDKRDRQSKANRYAATRNASRVCQHPRLKLPTWGISCFAPCAVKVACTVQGRGQWLIPRNRSNPLLPVHRFYTTEVCDRESRCAEEMPHVGQWKKLVRVEPTGCR